MFHVERIKNIFFAVVFLLFGAVSCITPRHTVEINDYILLPNGIEVLGKEQGLTAFMFENDPTKIPFQQFVADKYNIGNYVDVSYWVTVDGHRFKVFVYAPSDIEKYFDTSEFMVTNVETEVNIVGSKTKFLALSMISSANEDCLDQNSLYYNIAITYLKQLKDEYLRS